ncbi:MAG: hypothetical protein ACRDOA_17330, partial [Streptosporangiaceae bacterium]
MRRDRLGLARPRHPGVPVRRFPVPEFAVPGIPVPEGRAALAATRRMGHSRERLAAGRFRSPAPAQTAPARTAAAQTAPAQT